MFCLHLMSICSSQGLTTEIFLENNDGSIFQIQKDSGALPMYKQLIAIMPLMLIIMIFIIINIKINDRINLFKSKFFKDNIKDSDIKGNKEENTINLKNISETKSQNHHNETIQQQEIMEENENNQLIQKAKSEKINKKEIEVENQNIKKSSMKENIKNYFNTYQQLIVAMLCSLLFVYLSIQLSDYNVIRLIVPIASTMVLFTFCTISIHSILKDNSFSSLWLLFGYLKFDRAAFDIELSSLPKEEVKALRRLNYCFAHYLACVVLLSIPLFYAFYNEKNLYSITQITNQSIINQSALSGMVAPSQPMQQQTPILQSSGAAMTAAISTSSQLQPNTTNDISGTLPYQPVSQPQQNIQLNPQTITTQQNIQSNPQTTTTQQTIQSNPQTTTTQQNIQSNPQTTTTQPQSNRLTTP